ncbi:MAG: type II toxin-antitoxin system RelE/ParE family toxin [Acidobacteria bacterium]|nr:type II toxin-antitoxin system RelE/ParE family toxin [Acidobacteriota bacterium]
MSVRLSPEAESDIDAIWLYVARMSNSVEVADRFADHIMDRILLLARHPRLGRIRDTDLRAGLRSLPVGEYVIIYRLEDEAPVVLRVLRGSQNIPTFFQQ